MGGLLLLMHLVGAVGAHRKSKVTLYKYKCVI